MEKIGTGVMPARQILETTLMGAAIDFAISYERKNEANMRLIYKTVTQLLQADPTFTKDLLSRRERAVAQCELDIELMLRGEKPVTPGTPKS